MPQLDDDRDIRPRPDPTTLTTAQLDREIAHIKEQIGHLKELTKQDREHIVEIMGKYRESQQKALEVALASQDRRLDELNELRKAVEKDRAEFIRVDVYQPSHEELRRQIITISERQVGVIADIKTNATDVAELKSSMMWLSRLVVGAVVLAIIAYVFQRMIGR